MAKTKVKEFSACETKEINLFLSKMGIKYVDLKVIRWEPTMVDTLLLLIYEEDDLNLSIDKKMWKAYFDLLPVVLSRSHAIFDALSNLPPIRT